jgi:hypothetical protein
MTLKKHDRVFYNTSSLISCKNAIVSLSLSSLLQSGAIKSLASMYQQKTDIGPSSQGIFIPGNHLMRQPVQKESLSEKAFI